MVLMFRSRSFVPARPSPYRDRTNVVIAMAPNRQTADDALDSARMDDDGSPSLLVCNAAHAENTVACQA